MATVREEFLGAYEAARPVLSHPNVASTWDEESALAGFSVKGLAGHLVRAGEAVLSYLDVEVPADAKPIPAPAYYASVLSAMDEVAHRQVRERGEATAAGGFDRLMAARDDVAARLREVLPGIPSGGLVKVFGDLIVGIDDYLITRIVEILVHTDDLAVSVGLEPPEPPAGAVGLAIDHLVDVARLRHGDRRVLIAMSRRERDDVAALRVF